MNKVIYNIITVLLSFGTVTAFDLSISAFNQAGACPKLGFIPACYLVFLSFFIPLIVHLFKRYNTIFFFFTSLAFILAVFASVGQLLDKITCPKTAFGLPKCYLSFVFLFIIIGLKKRLLKSTLIFGKRN